MSATAAFGASGSRDPSTHSIQDPESLQTYFQIAGPLVIAALIAGAILQRSSLAPLLPLMAIWAAVVAVADLLPVQLWGEVSFSVSLPVTLSAGMLLGPLPAALVCAAGALDPRELRREVSFAKALYNRGQVAASVWIASVVFHSFGVPVISWPLVFLPTMAALATDFTANMLFVAIPVGVRMRVSAPVVLRRVFGESPTGYITGYISLGLVAVLQATLVHVVGLWGLVASLAPLGIARQVFVQGQRLGLARSRLESKDRALLDATEHVSEERRDERMALAGGLHDEVLPPLFKVHLMGQVLRQDLISGRLLDLDEDLPALLAATEAAQSAIRSLLGQLRRSPIGTSGLSSTIRLLARQLENAGSPRFVLNLQEVGGTYLSQLLIFQVAREAMTNAARHSRAHQVSVRLWKEDGMSRLMVADDGTGFDRSGVDKTRHFGLQIMVERVEAASGRVAIDSRFGEGTTVVAAIPTGISGDQSTTE